MPITTYSAEEYAELLVEIQRLKGHLDTAEAMRPIWAKGFSSDSIAAQSLANALHSLWTSLGATNQTEAMGLLQQLKARSSI